MKWFSGINTIEELKKAFRALVKKESSGRWRQP